MIVVSCPSFLSRKVFLWLVDHVSDGSSQFRKHLLKLFFVRNGTTSLSFSYHEKLG